MAIITLAGFKSYRGITTTDATRDSMLAILIAGAITKVTRYLGREVLASTYTEKYNGTGSETLILKQTPVTSITSITLTRPDGSSTAVDSTTYAVNLLNGVVKFDPAWIGRTVRDDWGWPLEDFTSPLDVSPQFPDGHQNITVVYVAGSNTIPDDLTLAMYQYVDLLYAESYFLNGSPTGFKSEHLGDYDYTKTDWSSSFIAIGDKVVSLKQAEFFSLFRPFQTGGMP